MNTSLKESFQKALEFRHACKAFDATRKISDDDFSYILNALHLAPSSFGLEAWKFVIIQNSNLREQIKTCAWGGQNQIPSCSHFMVLMHTCGTDLKYDGPLFEKYLIKRRQLPNEMAEKYRGFIAQFQRDDFDLLAEQRYLDDWAGKQVYIALAHLMLAAAVLGIDTCPMEGFNRAKVGEILLDGAGIDNKYFAPAVLLALGYRKDEQPEKFRRPLEEIVAWAN